MGPVVYAIRIHHNMFTKVLNPPMPTTIQMPINSMATALALSRMPTNPTATMSTTIRMLTSPSATTPTIIQMPTTPSAMVLAPMGTPVLDKALIGAHNPLTHHMGILPSILNSTSHTRARTRHLLDNTRSNSAAVTKTSIVAVMVSVWMTCHRLVTTCRTAMSIFFRQ